MFGTARFRQLSVLGLALALFSGTPAVASPQSPAEDASAALAQARALYESRNFQGACREYGRASQISQETSFAAWIGLTRCHLQLGERADAIASGRRACALARTPEDRAQATGVLGSALLAGGEQEQAEALDLLRADRATGGAPATRELLRALLALGRDHEAADVLHEGRAGKSEERWRVLLCQVLPGIDFANDAAVQKLNARLLALDPAAPLVLGGRMLRPKWLYTPLPKLSRAQRAKLEGPIPLQLILEEDGKIHEAALESEVPADLSEPLLHTLREWRFRPATLDGKGVPVCQTLVWRLALH